MRYNRARRGSRCSGWCCENKGVLRAHQKLRTAHGAGKSPAEPSRPPWRLLDRARARAVCLPARRARRGRDPRAVAGGRDSKIPVRQEAGCPPSRNAFSGASMTSRPISNTPTATNGLGWTADGSSPPWALPTMLQDRLGDLVYVETPAVGKSCPQGARVRSSGIGKSRRRHLRAGVRRGHRDQRRAAEQSRKNQPGRLRRLDVQLKPDDPAELESLLNTAGYRAAIAADAVMREEGGGRREINPG